MQNPASFPHTVQSSNAHRAHIASRALPCNHKQVCGEVLWIDLFTNVCSLFCFISLLESCVTLAVAHHSPSTGLNILSYSELASLIKTPAGWMHHGDEPALSAAAAVLFERRRESILAGRLLREKKVPRERPPLSKFGAAKIIANRWKIHAKRRKMKRSMLLFESSNAADMSKLLRFEAYFFEVDVEADDYLTMDELRTFLSYAAMDQPIAARIEALRSINRKKSNAANPIDEWGNAANKVSRIDFVRVCSNLLWDVPDEVIRESCNAYKNAVNTAKNNSENYWSDLAQTIDETSRIFIPGTFLICLFILFGTEFYDN